MNDALMQAWEMLRAGQAQLGNNPTLEQLRGAIEQANGAMPLSPGVDFKLVAEAAVFGIWCQPDDGVFHRSILYLHGGGYLAGSASAWKGLTGELALRCRARVLSLDYRRAPEHPFPMAVEDALVAYRWLLDQGISPESLAIAGDSAGGGLALATLFAAREAKLPMPAAIYLISPWADLDLAGSTILTKADADPLATPDALHSMADTYLGGHDRRDPLASPLYGDLAGLPPMLIQVGSEETLLDDSVRLAGRAGAAQVAVRLEIYPHLFHDFQVWHAQLAEARDALARAANFIGTYAGHPA
jgi:monoterpene epsilon-lactone hydrolase